MRGSTMVDLGAHDLGAALDRARIAARLADATSSADITRIVLEDVRGATGASAAIVAAPTDDGAYLVLATHGLHPAVAAAHSTLPIGSPLTVAAVYRTGQATYAEDRRAVLEAFGPGASPAPRSSAFAAFPIRTGAGVVAAAGLGFEAPRAFSPRDRAALDEIGRVLGSALDRAGLRDAERAARRRLEVLADATAGLLAVDGVATLVETLARVVSSAIGDPCIVRLLAPDGRDTGPSAFVHPDPGASAALAAALAAAPEPAAVALRAAALAGETLFRPVADPTIVATAAAAALRPYLERFPVYGLVLAPLRTSEGVIGTVATLRHRPNSPYTRHDRLLVEGLADRAALAVAHARLAASHEEARLRAERAAARTARLQEITAALAGAETRADVARIATRLAIGSAGAARGGIALSGADGRLRVVAIAGVGVDEAQLGQDPLGAAGTRLALALARGAPLYFPDTAAIRADHPELVAAPDGALAVLPLSARDGLAGALGLRYAGARPFDAEERAFLENLGVQCGLALDRAGLRDREREAARRKAILAETSRALSEAQRDLRRVFDTLATHVASDLDVLCAVTLIVDGRLELQAVHHRDPALVEDVRATFSEEPMRVDEGPHAPALRRGHPTLLTALPAEARADLRPAHAAFFARHPPTAFAVVPLRIDGRVQGALHACQPGGPPLCAEDLSLLEELADRAGLTIAHAWRHEELIRERQRLGEVLERAEVASRAKDEFLAMLSHELRNPLAPIVTALQLMRQREGAEGSSRERAVVERQVAHLVRLVDDLLDVSRVTRGKVRLVLRPVALPEVVARAVETASPLLEERRHTLSLEIPDDLWIQADAHRVAQVIANLLTNAAKYTDPGGRITIRAAADGATARVAVQDSGIGISPALLPHLFDPFVQGERLLDRSPGGLGIGLSIARSLVELHGGRICAESGGPGGGSTFTFWIPLAAGAAAERAPAFEARAAARAPAPAGLPVLVVDDNVDAAELLAEALRMHGHDVHVAFDGPSALALACEIRPRIALLDIGLPVMDGYELARRLQEAPATADVALVAVTGYGQDVDRRASADAGFRMHLVKPVELERVCEVVDELARP